VNGLPDRYEIDARVVEVRIFGGGHAVRHAFARRRVRDLLGARVRRDDFGEVLREAARRLPGPRASVPAKGVAIHERRERLEELRGIRGAVARVVARVPRKMIFEIRRAQISSRR
jgi:sugar/nucleoside kinase (ribokinase family)